MKIKDLYYEEIPGIEKKARRILSGSAEELPVLHTAIVPQRELIAPEWCKASDEDIKRGVIVAQATASNLRGIAAKQTAFNIIWKANWLPLEQRSDKIESVQSIGLGIYQVTLSDGKDVLVAGGGWVKRLGDVVAGGHSLEKGRQLFIYKEDDCRFGKIITKFDTV